MSNPEILKDLALSDDEKLVIAKGFFEVLDNNRIIGLLDCNRERATRLISVLKSKDLLLEFTSLAGKTYYETNKKQVRLF